MTLTEKIECSKKVIKEAFNLYKIDDCGIAWTGGKDSTILLWLIKEVCKDITLPIPKVMFINEGSVFNEIYQLVETVNSAWNIFPKILQNTDILKKVNNIGNIVHVDQLNEQNREEIIKIGYEKEYFKFEPESFIGNHLMKTVVLNNYIEENNFRVLFTGIRWDEQEARNKEEYFSKRKNPVHFRVHPILHFTERDIWDNIRKNKIFFCSLYSQGYRSLGAKGSTEKHANIPAWEQDLKNTPERIGRGKGKEKIMEKLRSLGYM